MREKNRFDDWEEEETPLEKKKRKKRSAKKLDAFNMPDTPILPKVQIDAERQEIATPEHQPEIELTPEVKKLFKNFFDISEIVNKWDYDYSLFMGRDKITAIKKLPNEERPERFKGIEEWSDIKTDADINQSRKIIKELYDSMQNKEPFKSLSPIIKYVSYIATLDGFFDNLPEEEKIQQYPFTLAKKMENELRGHWSDPKGVAEIQLKYKKLLPKETFDEIVQYNEVSVDAAIEAKKVAVEKKDTSSPSVSAQETEKETADEARPENKLKQKLEGEIEPLTGQTASTEKTKWMPEIGTEAERENQTSEKKTVNERKEVLKEKKNLASTPEQKISPDGFVIGQEVIGIDKHSNPEPGWKIIGWTMKKEEQVAYYFLVKRKGDEKQKLELTAERLRDLQQSVTLETENEKKKTEQPVAPQQPIIEEEISAEKKEKKLKKSIQNAYFQLEYVLLDNQPNPDFKNVNKNDVKNLLDNKGLLRAYINESFRETSAPTLVYLIKEGEMFNKEYKESRLGPSLWIYRKIINLAEEVLKQKSEPENPEVEPQPEPILPTKTPPEEPLQEPTLLEQNPEEKKGLESITTKDATGEEKTFKISDKVLSFTDEEDYFFNNENAEKKAKECLKEQISESTPKSEKESEEEKDKVPEEEAGERVLDEVDLAQIAEVEEELKKALDAEQEETSADEFWKDVDGALKQESSSPQDKEKPEEEFLNKIKGKSEAAAISEPSEKAKGFFEKIANFGSKIEEKKAGWFKRRLSWLSQKADWSPKVSEFLNQWSDNYQKKEERERSFQKNQTKDYWQKGFGVMKVWANASKIVLAPFFSSYRLAMYATLFGTEAAGAAKETRLHNQEITWLDEDLAEEEAWKLYEQADIGKKLESQALLEGKQESTQVSQDKQSEWENDVKKLREAYRQGLPERLMKRLEHFNKKADNREVLPTLANITNTLTTTIAGRTIVWQLRYWDEKVKSWEAEKKAGKISETVKNIKIGLVRSFSQKLLEDMDKAIGRAGAVDALAMGFKGMEMAGKAASAVFIAESYVNLTKRLHAIYEHPELLSKIWEAGTEKLSNFLGGGASVSLTSEGSGTAGHITPSPTKQTVPSPTKEASPTPTLSPSPSPSPTPTYTETPIKPSPTEFSPTPTPQPTETFTPAPSATEHIQPSLTPVKNVLSEPANVNLQETTSARGYLALAESQRDHVVKVEYLQRAADMEIKNNHFGEAEAIIKNAQAIINEHQNDIYSPLLEGKQDILTKLENKLPPANMPKGQSDWSVYGDKREEPPFLGDMAQPDQSAASASAGRGVNEQVNLSGISGKRGIYGGAEQFVQKAYVSELSKFTPGSDEYQAALAHHADRVKDLLVADIKNNGGKKFGLEGVANPDKISAEQFNKIKWNEVQKAVASDKIFHKELKPEEIENIVNYNEPQVHNASKTPVSAPAAEQLAAAAKFEIKAEDIGFSKETTLTEVPVPVEHPLLPNERLLEANDKYVLVGAGNDKKPFAIMEFPQGTTVDQAIQKAEALNVELAENHIPLEKAPALVEFAGKNNLPLENVAKHYFWLDQEKQGLNKQQIADIIRLAENQNNQAALNELISGNKDSFPYEDYEYASATAPKNVSGRFENITVHYRRVGREQQNYDVTLFASADEKGRIALDGEEVAKFELKQAKEALKDPAGFVKKAASI
ncbi:hypothetical protein COU00_02175 [Candidatus Falkowbacteria bacterium CG10_big_fil_rev_8_21_14_0_10_43_11]|uniref:Uncharacterized protein n=1 Tax=Candidatus Falkowbacteria bacterium CG10_big_fil_rev_8_21_14_0_10_43_11 TaxID=1974568 RepID=A0A2M6WM24_9BACT|nr:MAG: hypothetical protein COU00_02175 [Candidatus Falkowbacteria bacterium CG10_big_fil_rev_8_21_14_0_10_43_11]